MWVERPRVCIHWFSALVKPNFCCFQTQNTANNANAPHIIRYLVRIFGVVIYSVNTKKAHTNWKAIRRADVYQPPMSIPSRHVSLSTSIVQNALQTMRQRNITLSVRSNFNSDTSMIANASNNSSSISLGNDIGIGRVRSFSCMK